MGNTDTSLWGWREVGGYQSFFSTKVSQQSSFFLCYSIWAVTESLSPSQKNRMRLDSFGAPSVSNLIVEMLEMRHPIVNFHLRVLRVLSNTTPSGIYGSLWVTQIFSKKSLELNPIQGIFDCLVLTLVLVPTKTDSTARKWSCKRSAVGAKGVDDIDMILELLKGLLGSLRVWDHWLQLGGTNWCRTLTSSENFLVYLAEAVVGTRSQVLLEMRSHIWKTPQEHLDCCAWLSVIGCFCESESWVPLLWSGVWYYLTELFQTGWLTRWVWSN